MADARLRSEWLGQMRFDDLSDAAWRVFTSALMWSIGNGTDGVIPKRYLRYLHPDGVIEDAVRVELVKAGLWTEQSDTFVMLDWTGDLGQSTAEQIEKYRSDARDRQRRRRERAKQSKGRPAPADDGEGPHKEDVTADVTRDVTPNVGNGKGKGLGNGRGIQETPEITDWATAEIPDGTGEWGSPDSPGAAIASRVTSPMTDRRTA